jgi:hypothetical protein
MYKLLRRPLIFKLIIWSMLGPFLIMNGGCHYFRVHSSTQPYADVIQKMQAEKKFIILHLDDKAWYFTDIQTDERNITGTLSLLSGHDLYKTANPDKANRYKKSLPNNDENVQNEVHMYVSELEISERVNASIPVDAIKKVEVYSKATGANVVSYLWPVLGLFGGALAVGGIILALTSCPFIYVFNGADYLFTGEIFSGAIQPGLERDDYLPLPGINPVDGTYLLRVTNELKERQYIDECELILIDHNKEVSVLIDKYGFPFTVHSPQAPVSAVTGDNTDILPLVSARDTKNFTGIEGIADENSINSIILKFLKPGSSASGRLLLKAKNTIWMETVSSRIHELFGERYNSFSEKRDKVSGDKLQKWQLDQNLPLSVYIEKNNKWELVDYFNIAGPAALRDDILQLNLEDIASDTVKIKLETGFLFWEVDYAAMDFSNQKEMAVTRMPLTTAIASNDLDVREALAASDKIYYVLDEQGDEANLVFDCPELKSDCRSVFLHSRGYYKVLRDQTGPPDKKTLRSFRKSGRIPGFSREMYDGMK